MRQFDREVGRKCVQVGRLPEELKQFFLFEAVCFLQQLLELFLLDQQKVAVRLALDGGGPWLVIQQCELAKVVSTLVLDALLLQGRALQLFSRVE